MVNYHQGLPFGRIFLDMAKHHGANPRYRFVHRNPPQNCVVIPYKKHCKINMEHKNGGLEDDFSFQLGAF